MIRFELNNPDTFALTNDQFGAISDIIMADSTSLSLDYDIVESDGNANHVKLWVHHKQGNPDRIGIRVDGEIICTEEVDWDWKGIQHDN